MARILPASMNYPHDSLTLIVEKCIPSPVWRLLLEFREAQLSGGFVRDAIVGDAYKDIDIYFETQKVAEDAANWLSVQERVKVEVFQGKFECEINVLAPNTDGSQLIFDSRVVQLIYNHKIIDFDLACCMSTYSPDRGLKLMQGVQERHIRLLNPTPGSLKRMYKLIRRGWRCSMEELVKAAQVYQPEGPNHDS